MTPFHKVRGTTRLVSQAGIERVMLLIVFTGLLYVLQHYLAAGHLPRPFNSDPSQSLMDFYNTAYWANRPGAYDIWHTVYPPLSLLFTEVITRQACYAGTAYEARACDPAGAAIILAFYVLNVVLVFLSLRRLGAVCAMSRTLALCLGLPMLYGLELANLIIPCFTFFVLAEGGLVRSRWARHFCRALAFNFKLYLLVTILPSVLQRRGRWLIAAAIFFLSVYLSTLLFYGDGTPRQIIIDLVFYSREQAKLYFAQNHLAAINAASGHVWDRVMPGVLRTGEVVALIGLISGTFLKGATNRRRLAALALTIISAEAAINTHGFSADYTQIFLIFLLFLERRWNLSTAILVTTAYLLCVPADVTVVHSHWQQLESFFSGSPVQVEFGLTASQFFRPLCIVAIQVILTWMAWKAVLDNIKWRRSRVFVRLAGGSEPHPV